MGSECNHAGSGVHSRDECASGRKSSIDFMRRMLDQSHLIREFKALAGVTPEQYVAERYGVEFVQYDDEGIALALHHEHFDNTRPSSAERRARWAHRLHRVRRGRRHNRQTAVQLPRRTSVPLHGPEWQRAGRLVRPIKHHTRIGGDSCQHIDRAGAKGWCMPSSSIHGTCRRG